jgi:hypothetical protein
LVFYFDNNKPIDQKKTEPLKPMHAGTAEKELNIEGMATDAIKTVPISEAVSASLVLCDFEIDLTGAFITILYQASFSCKVFEM